MLDPNSQPNANAQRPGGGSLQNNANVNPSLIPNYQQGMHQDAAQYFSNLDASSSKQLAALTAAGNVRRATLSQPGGTSGGFVGGMASPQHGFGPASALGHGSPGQLHQAHNSAVVGLPSASTPFNMPPQGDPSLLHRQNMNPMMSAQNMNAQSYRVRQQSFLGSVAKIMVNRNTPLPPSITGVQVQYDPSTWKGVEPASEIGGFKLAGKDVDLYKLWTLVFQAGGSNKIQQQNAWGSLLPHLGLPDVFPSHQDNTPVSTAIALARHYMALLGPFEEAYLRNETQRQNAMQNRASQGFPGQPNGMPGAGMPGSQIPVPGANVQGTPFQGQTIPQTPQLRPNSGMMGMIPGSHQGHSMSPPSSTPGIAQNQIASGTEATGPPFPTGGTDLDMDLENRKRKMNEFDDLNGKRSRRKTDSEPPVTPSRPGSDTLAHPHMTAPVQGTSGPARSQPHRRKIEYVPLSREVETSGGRDVNQIQAELIRIARGRSLRDINEWGRVHINALTMSLRSRISTELSYALTTIVILSTMRGQTPDSGFPISQCEELLDEVLDLLEEAAFDDAEDTETPAQTLKIVTNRQLVNYAQEENSAPFASTKRLPGQNDPTRVGPVQRRGDIIRIILNILRNLSAVGDNIDYLGQHPVVPDLLLRLTYLHTGPDDIPRAASPSLSLPDLTTIRKEVLMIFVNLARAITLSSSTTDNTKNERAKRIFELVASYLVDPVDSISPVAFVVHSGVSNPLQARPPVLADAALEVFSRVSQPDVNRQIISNTVPKEWIWTLFEALIHRLPTVDMDYQFIYRDESWMAYMEKLALSLYSIAYLMPPDLKKRTTSDRQLGFTKVALSVVKRFMGGGLPQSEVRLKFYYCCRRLIEAMKLIDDGGDSFDSSQPSLPPLSFGVGYGEVGDKRVEKGFGLWGGYRDEVLWQIMMQRELDEVMFTELESLARVDPGPEIFVN